MTTEAKPVNICFSNMDISLLFGQLVAAMGAEALIVKDIDARESDVLLITEAGHFDELSDQERKNSLFVTNPGVDLPTPARTLSRPLTEDALVTALSDLLEVEISE